MKFKGNHKYQEIQSIKLVAIKTKKWIDSTKKSPLSYNLK